MFSFRVVSSVNLIEELVKANAAIVGKFGDGRCMKGGRGGKKYLDF